MKKNPCFFCFNKGLSRYWWDTGIAMPDGSRMPVRIVLTRHEPDAYSCDRCGLPRDLEPPPGSRGEKLDPVTD